MRPGLEGAQGRRTIRAEPGIDLAVLRSCALFEVLSDAELSSVARMLRTRRFRRNEVIFHAGDPGDSMFVIKSGSVKIVASSSEGDEGIIDTLGPGDFFGELALLDGPERSVTAVAITPTVLGSLNRAPFLELVDAHPGVQRALLVGLAAKLRRLTRHAEELLFFDLPNRLAIRLVQLAYEANGSGPGAELDWPYTQSDLAAMIGSSRQSVSRMLSHFVDQGLLRIERDTILIPDVEELARMVAEPATGSRFA